MRGSRRFPGMPRAAGLPKGSIMRRRARQRRCPDSAGRRVWPDQPEETVMHVGFIGVGNMGGPMCRNIIRNTNHEVVVFDLNADAVKACTDLGAAAGASVADVARRCD